jgi:hypothetical protein
VPGGSGDLSSSPRSLLSKSASPSTACGVATSSDRAMGPSRGKRRACQLSAYDVTARGRGADVCTYLSLWTARHWSALSFFSAAGCDIRSGRRRNWYTERRDSRHRSGPAEVDVSIHIMNEAPSTKHGWICGNGLRVSVLCGHGMSGNDDWSALRSSRCRWADEPRHDRRGCGNRGRASEGSYLIHRTTRLPTKHK